MPLRRAHRQSRLGRLSTTGRGVPVRAVGLLAAIAVAAGCASTPDSGFYHTVRSGDTVYSIARRYGVTPVQVVRANGIRDVHAIPIGTRLWIPVDGRRPPTGGGNGAGPPGAAPPAAREPLRPRAPLRLDWPVHGTITSGFGRRHGRSHDGLDIAAKHGTPIRAAGPGKVIFAGRLGAYGRMVVIKHEGTYRTVYAHARQLYVKKGQFVERGQRIATVGTSGNATGPHLHFEVRHRDHPVDPAPFLP